MCSSSLDIALQLQSHPTAVAWPLSLPLSGCCCASLCCCCCSTAIQELARGVRAQLSGLISDLGAADLRPMSLGLSHSLSRYKLKFSPEKVDTMIVQVCLQGLGKANAVRFLAAAWQYSVLLGLIVHSLAAAW